MERLYMIPEKLIEVIKHEGVVSIVTMGKLKPHVVNTWNSYVTLTDENHMLIPVGGMKVTEQNVLQNNLLLLTLGSREVDGLRSKGTGFLIEAKGEFVNNGKHFITMKSKYPWIRSVLVVKPISIDQTL